MLLKEKGISSIRKNYVVKKVSTSGKGIIPRDAMFFGVISREITKPKTVVFSARFIRGMVPQNISPYKEAPKKGMYSDGNVKPDGETKSLKKRYI
jgi:hypothetical protein